MPGNIIKISESLNVKNLLKKLLKNFLKNLLKNLKIFSRMDSLIWKTATSKSLKNLPIQYYAYLKQSNQKFFPGNYFTIPETINKGLQFLEDIWSSPKFLNTNIDDQNKSSSNSVNAELNNKDTAESSTHRELYASVLCLELFSDLENVNKRVVQTLRKMIRFVLKIAPFSFTGIQDILERDVSSAALVTWILMKEQILTKHAAKYLARQVIAKIDENKNKNSKVENTMDPITSVNVMRLLYQVGLHSESTENFLYESLESKSYMNMENDCSPDAFLYFLSATIANCEAAKHRFEDLLIERLEERIGEPTEHSLDSSMRILAFESVGLLQSAKNRNRLCEEFTTLKNLQKADGSWACSSWTKNSLLCGKIIGIGANLLYRDGKVITSAFALKAVHVFYERRKKSLVGNEHTPLHIIS